MRKIGYVRVSSQTQNEERQLKSIKDNWLNLSENNPYSQFLITIMAGVNQLEKDLLKMRQKEGIEIAKMNYAIKLYFEKTMTVKQICEITNISRASLYRRLKEILIYKTLNPLETAG